MKRYFTPQRSLAFTLAICLSLPSTCFAGGFEAAREHAGSRAGR